MSLREKFQDWSRLKNLCVQIRSSHDPEVKSELEEIFYDRVRKYSRRYHEYFNEDKNPLDKLRGR